MRLKNGITRRCRRCGEEFIAWDIKTFECSSCTTLVEISCLCGCGEKIKRRQWEVKLGKAYKLGHHLRGKTYLQIHGTNIAKCGFQRGESNIAKRKEVREKISTSLKLGAHWIFTQPGVAKRRTSRLESLVAPYLRGWERQYLIGKYSVDFAQLEEKKVIEINGCYWHNCIQCGFSSKVPLELLTLSREAEQKKLDFLSSKGWDVKVIWEHEVPAWIASTLSNQKTTVTRFHDICAGHRVYGHENRCSHTHGHNYRIHFTCTASKLDNIGRIIDFAVINKLLCNWLEENWDHRFLLWTHDPWLLPLKKIDPTVVGVPFNPTAENIAKHLVEIVGPVQLKGTGVHLTECKVEETRKCSSTYQLSSTIEYCLKYTNSGLMVLPKILNK